MAADDLQLAKDGWRLVREGEHQQGIALLQRASEVSPTAMHLVGLGVAYLFIRDFDLACQHFDRLIEKKPKHMDKYYQLAGVARWLMGQSREAAKVWQSGIGCAYTDGAGGVTTPLLLMFAAARHQESVNMAEARNLLMKSLQRSWAKNWPGPIGRFMAGECDEVELRQNCQGAHDLDTRTRHLMVDFYAAVSQLASGRGQDFSAAMSAYAFRIGKVDPEGKEWDNEYHLARHESNVLTNPPTSDSR